MPTRLENATLVDPVASSVRTGSITVDGDQIVDVGDGMVSAGTVLDMSGRIVMPGNVCGHTHVYSALARGMPGPARSPRNFPEILELVWWKLDRALDEDSIRSSGLIGALDAIRSGTTTLIDHHASPECIDGSLDVLADAFEEVGCRGVLCYEVTDRGGKERRDAGLRENERFLRTQRNLVRGTVGAHASFTLDDDSLQNLAELATRSGTGIHIHVAEDICDEQDSLQRCGKRVAYRLADAGILRPNSIAAHGVHLDDGELDAIHTAGSWLVHNCRSNMNNSVGRAPVVRFGPDSALGTDGIDEDMFAESRTAFFPGREESLDWTAEATLAMLGGGARLASRFFDLPVGVLTPGAAADLVVLDYDPPTPLTPFNLAWHWAFAFNSGLVESVMVGGKWVLRDREFVGIDEARIRHDARVQAEHLWHRMSEL